MSNNNYEELDVHSFIEPKYKTKRFKITMSNETKQTAVDWFAEQISSKNLLGIYTYDEMVMFDDLLKQANKMFEEQIIKTHGVQYDYSHSQIDPDKITGEQYYNETYGGNK